MNEPNHEHDGEHEELPDPSLIPRWVPVLIGIILAAMAGLAVFTGFRYHDSGITSHVRPRRDRPATFAPPGEPGAGASLVLHGESGENTPTAGAPVRGDSRVEIRGSGAGVEAVRRFRARRGMMLEVSPADAVVYVNNLPIGQVSQFDGADEVYDFANPGSYDVRVVAPGGGEEHFVVTASDDAPQEIATIAATLK